MDLEQIKSELSNKTVEELAKIQEECMLTIRPCLVALTEKVEIDVSKSFFLFCMSYLKNRKTPITFPRIVISLTIIGSIKSFSG